MIFNWLDIVFLIILVLTLVIGLIKGLIRQIVGILAVIIGLVLGLAYYPYVGAAFITFENNRATNHPKIKTAKNIRKNPRKCVMISLSTKGLKGPLKFFNHIFGGLLGVLKGILICGVLVLAMLVFPVGTKAMQNSTLAPYCVKLTRGIVELIPRELKERFEDTYHNIFNREGKDAKRI